MPISCLPPEVLARVFASLAKVARPEVPFAYVLALAPGGPSPDLGWILVTHVCRQWRQVAIHHSTLWSDVAVDLGPDWVEEKFRRARGAHLTIDDSLVWCRPKYDTLRLHRLIFSNFRRIKNATVNLPSDDYGAPSLRDWLSTPVPYLQSLSICAKNTVDLPADFLGERAPQLRCLILENFARFPWKSGVFHGLVHLKLSRCPAVSAGDCEDVLDTLEHMPALEYLDLDGLVPSHAHPSPSEDARVITLPHLADVKLYGDSSDCLALLRHCALPSLAKIRVMLRHGAVGPDGDLPAFLDILRDFSRTSASFDITIAKLFIGMSWGKMGGAHSSLQVQGWRAASVKAEDVFPDVHLVFCWPRQLDGAAAMVSAICDQFCTEDLKELTLDEDLRQSNPPERRVWTSESWRTNLARAVNLRNVDAHGPTRAALREPLAMLNA